MSLENRKLVLAVSGGVAAYKAAELCSLLQKRGAEVRVAMTASAREFISALTFEALTQHPVYTDVLRTHTSYEMEHITWARWADAVVVAPATANCIAKLAAGLCDDSISTLLLSFSGPVFVAPSMNTQMLMHPATLNNLELLRSRGVRIIEPEAGPLACGEVGPGRLADPAHIVRLVAEFGWENSRSDGVSQQGGPRSGRPYQSGYEKPTREQTLAGKTVLITSGPTHERIDSVRYLSNPSSGKMGASLAREAAWRGAVVHLVSGPVEEQQLPSELATVHKVTTGEEMLHAVQKLASAADLFIFAAAVSDFRVASPVHHKIKRTGNSITLPLIENPDISQAVGYTKQPGQVTIGFAAETENLENNALGKLERKKLDAIIANNVEDREIGFASENNEVTIYFRDGRSHHIDRKSKSEVAREIFDAIEPLLPPH